MAFGQTIIHPSPTYGVAIGYDEGGLRPKHSGLVAEGVSRQSDGFSLLSRLNSPHALPLLPLQLPDMGLELHHDGSRGHGAGAAGD